MTHKIDIIWHDLIEDPKDLPKTDDYYWTLCLNRYTEELCGFAYADCYEMFYLPDNRVWIAEDIEDCGHVAYESHLTPRKHKPFEAEADSDSIYSDEIVIVAWAEKPKQYMPAEKGRINQ